MPVSIPAGHAGSIVLSAGDAQYYASFTITSGADLIDTSRYGNDYRSRTAGLKDLAGTATAFLTVGAADQNPFVGGTSGTATITFAAGVTISAAVVIGNVTIAHSIDGVGIVTFTWSHEGSVDPTITWA